MQDFTELVKGPTLADPELRWIGDLRDFLRRCTDMVDTYLLVTKGRTEVELVAHLRLTHSPNKELMQVMRKAAKSFAKAAAPKYVLQRVEIDPRYRRMTLVIFKKKEGGIERAKTKNIR